MLGVALCQHKKQKFKLTEEGSLVFHHAKHVFSSVRTLYDAIDRLQSQPKMPLHFVATHSIGLSLLPGFLPSFQEKYPQISQKFLLGGLSQLRGWLKQGIAEFALVLESDAFADYASVPIYSGVFSLFKNRNEKKCSDECGVYVENQRGMFVEEFQKKYAKTYGRSLPIKAELNSWELMARCMQSSGGYGFFPDLICTHNRYSELLPVKKRSLEVSYTLCAVHLKGEALSYSAQVFIEGLAAYQRF